MFKRLLPFIFALALSASAFATTLNPVQLLNPAGSTSGQAIVSTGASTAPGWSSIVNSVIAGSGVTVSGATGNVTVSVATNGVGLGQIAQIGANTVLGNATGSTANVTALAVPSCSTSSSAVQYTSGTGWGCNVSINAATLQGATFASPPATGYGFNTPEPVAATTITATSTISPSQTAGIVGTTTNNNANAGSVGEYPTPSTVTGTSLTNNTPINVGSLSLTAGDWDVTGSAEFHGTSVVMTAVVAGPSTTSATLGAFGTFGGASNMNGSVTAATQASVVTLPVTRFSLSSTTTVFCVLNQTFSAGTMTGDCFLRARRIR